jgi:outer membrane protein assembly factor BamB
MRRFTVATYAAMLAASWSAIGQGQLADSSWPMFRHDARHTGLSPFGGPEVPVLGWSYYIGGDIVSSPALDPAGRVYIGAGSRVYCMDSGGSLVWSYIVTDWVTYSSPALDAAGRVFVGAYDNKLWCFNSNGSRQWDRDLGGDVRSSPVINDSNWVFLGTDANVLYALDDDSDLKWSYRTAAAIASSPAIDPWGRTLFASGPYTFCINSSGGRDWFTWVGTSDSSPAVDSSGNTYIGSTDNKIYCLNSSGTIMWTYATGNDIGWSSPAIAPDGGIVIGSSDDKVYSLNSNGSLRWAFTTGGDISESSAAVDSAGRVFIGSRDNRLYCIGSEGSVLWTYVMAMNVSSPAIGADGRVYVGVGVPPGGLFCIGPTQTPIPTDTPTPTPTPPIDLTPDKATFATTDRISVTANVWPISIPCYPFVRVLMADGRTLYYERGRGFINSPTPYLGFERGPLTVASSILGYPVLSAGFSGIAVGTYYLEGGAVDATQTTSASNLVYIGTVDREALVVQ